MANMTLRAPKAAAGAIVTIGAIYFVEVFTVAFIMGIARTLLIAPRFGPTTAVLLEVPIIVAISWWIARWILYHKDLALPERAAVGAIAFTMMLVSEAVFASVILGQGLGVWAAALLTPLGLVGLAGQVVFGTMPMIVFREKIALVPTMSSKGGPRRVPRRPGQRRR